MNPISSATAALQAGLARFDSASLSLTKTFDGSSSVDSATAVVDQITAGDQVKASAAVVRVSDRMLKALLDITV